MPIEAIAVAAEKTAEVGAKAAEMSAKAAETGKKAVDISKRIDVTKNVVDGPGKGIDISKRIVPKEVGQKLTAEQAKELTSKGFSPGSIENVTYQDGVYKLKTQNQDLAGKKHPETGVKYEKKLVDLFGSKIEGVFPEFESKFTAQLPKDKLLASDKVQFSECNAQLKDAINNNSKLRSKFSQDQIDMINDGKKPRGYTWNHNEKTGQMDLVDTKKHDISKHTGGKAIWGGGSSMR